MNISFVNFLAVPFFIFSLIDSEINLKGNRLIGITVLVFFFFNRPKVLRAHSQSKAQGPIPLKIKYHFLPNPGPLN